MLIILEINTRYTNNSIMLKGYEMGRLDSYFLLYRRIEYSMEITPTMVK